MFKTPSFRSFNRPNGRRRSQNNDTMTLDTMFTPAETQNHTNAVSQRLTKPRTNTNSVCLGKPETSSSRATPINSTNDYAEDARLSFSNDSPLSFTGSGSLYHSESPSRSATNLHSQDVRSRNPSSASINSSKRRSAAVDNSDVDVAAAIALLQELKKRASPEDLILLHKALLPTKNVERAISPAKPETREYEEPLSPLIRRSSLLPAGVKTRLSRELLRNFSENNVTVRSASSSREPTAAQSPRLDMPLNFEALDLADGTTETQGGRPVTPSDFFPQIGTYKMGSLRITNGAASPEPGRLLRMAENANTQQTAQAPAPESVSGDGFVTADEGESSPECVRPTRATVVPLRAPRRSSERQETRGLSDIRARSKSRGPPVRRSSEDEMNRSIPRQSSRPRVSQRASEYAQEYASECDVLEPPHMSSPALTTTVSRLSTVHDESPVEEGTGGREEALRRLTGEASSADNRSQTTQSQKHLSVTRPPMHAKSDSGYSSEASRRSIVKESNVEEFLLAAIDAADQAERTRSKGSPGPASARPSLEQIREDTISSPRSPYVQQITAAHKAERHRSLPSFFSKKSASSTSVNTIGAIPVTPAKQTRKLQKSRPQSQVVVNQSPQELEPALEVVHNAPEDSSFNFSRPSRRTDRTSASPQPKPVEDDNDRRGRGRSRKQDANSQPTSKEDPPEEPTTRRSRSIFRGFRSRSRSKSQHRRDDEVTVLSVTDEPLPSNTFNDFGTVAQSLGQSPYDIATRRVKQMGAYDSSKPWFHPHEISRAAPEVSSTNNNRGKSLDRGQQDRARSQSRPRESVDAERSSSRPPTRGKTRRSQSVHNIALPRVPEPVPELPKQENLSGTFSRPASKDGSVRVGTIDFGNGFGQGRLEPILTKTEKAKTRRRTQSVSPRVRPNAVSPMIPEEPVPQTPTPQVSSRELPQVPSRELPKVPSLDLPQIPDRAPPKVPTHGKQTSVLPPALSVSTKPACTKESTSVPQTPASPASPSMHSAWESQALAWRERKQSIGEMLSSPTTERKGFMSPKLPNSPVIHAYSPTLQAPRRAPTVVVSRYITPQGSEFAMHLGEDPYKDLHANNPTDLRPAQEDVERTDSSSTYRTATSERSQDSFATIDSAKYRAYRPVDGAAADKVNSPTIPAAPAVPKSNTTQKRASRAVEPPKRRSTAPPEEPAVPFDRFSGGLAYGWERGVGFGGSAGTRQKNDNKAARKSVAISQNFGVDLSDVPVFMVRQ